uniref:Uncharacterized protein n=1 Tax=Anguilla anguilla TaxID=7936 RepID=A0A0E9S251_ANGAN
MVGHSERGPILDLTLVG